MDDAIEKQMRVPLDSQAVSKPVSDILTMLRAMSNPAEGYQLFDFHSHRLASESRRMVSRSSRTACEAASLSGTLRYTCASATVLGVLQMLSGFFE